LTALWTGCGQAGREWVYLLCKTPAPPAGKARYVPVANVVGGPCTEPSQVVKITTPALGLAAETQPVSRGYFDGCFRRVFGRFEIVASGQDPHPGPGAGAGDAGPAGRTRTGQGRRDRQERVARLVETAVCRHRRRHRRQPAAKMGGDAPGAGRGHRAGSHLRHAAPGRGSAGIQHHELPLCGVLPRARRARTRRAPGLRDRRRYCRSRRRQGRIHPCPDHHAGAPCCTFRYKFT
jgi:hypothetical protein